MKHRKYFKVTTTIYYEIPYHSKHAKDEKITDINGYTEQELQNDWFDSSLHINHATRDAHLIGDVGHIDGVEIVDVIPEEHRWR